MRKQSDCVCFLHRYMKPRASLSKTWHFVKMKVYADQNDNDPTSVIAQVGAPIASAGGNVTGLENQSSNDIPRRVQRVNRKIAEMENQYNNGGYADPRFKQWLDARNQPNIQRDAWQDSLTTVLAMETGVTLQKTRKSLVKKKKTLSSPIHTTSKENTRH